MQMTIMIPRAVLVFSLFLTVSCGLNDRANLSSTASSTGSSATNAASSSAAPTNVLVTGTIRGNSGNDSLCIGIVDTFSTMAAATVSTTNQSFNFSLNVDYNSNKTFMVLLVIDQDRNGVWDYHPTNGKWEGYQLLCTLNSGQSTNLDLDLVQKRVHGNITGTGAADMNVFKVKFDSTGMLYGKVSNMSYDATFPVVSNRLSGSPVGVSLHLQAPTNQYIFTDFSS